MFPSENHPPTASTSLLHSPEQRGIDLLERAVQVLDLGLQAKDLQAHFGQLLFSFKHSKLGLRVFTAESLQAMFVRVDKGERAE
jgi:hypothetical protein